ncbi:unnamed protein product, partial [Didymodactylos carnosus]
PGHIVEIDGSCFGKRKYQRGRLLKTQWVFGGIDINTRKCFLVPVDQRDATALLPIIEEYVLPGNADAICDLSNQIMYFFILGTTIHSDEWRAYNALRNNPDYIHLTVNHSISFVNPNTGVHTQNIENTWMLAKRKHKKQGGFNRHLLQTYLEEFMWRQEFGDEPLKNLVLQINSLHPVQ